VGAGCRSADIKGYNNIYIIIKVYSHYFPFQKMLNGTMGQRDDGTIKKSFECAASAR
jgi:hypothetical protein